jgi:hypothetical protein
MADVTYVRHRIPEFQAFEAPTGMVGQWTAQRAAQVAAHAISLAPKPGQGRGYATGETAASIRVHGPTRGRSGPEATVSSNTDHALFVHEGTKPHTIKPRLAPKLVFFWRKAGRVVQKNKVFHPGTPANPFLLKALRTVFGGFGR